MSEAEKKPERHYGAFLLANRALIQQMMAAKDAKERETVARLAELLEPEELHEELFRIAHGDFCVATAIRAYGTLLWAIDDLLEAERKIRVVRLRELPYAEYLKSEHWLTFRAKMYAAAEHRCQLCNSAGHLHVHHRTYERLGEEKPEDVIVLCADCHGKFHDKLPKAPGV